MKKILTIWLFFAAAGAWSDTNSHWEKAKEYVFLSGAAVIMESVIETQEAIIDNETEVMFHALTSQQFMSDDIDIHLREHNLAAKNAIRAVFDPAKMSERIIPLYMANFSEAELDQMISFYKSTAGTLMRERLPLILMQTKEIDKELGQELVELMMPIHEKLQKDLGLVQ